MRNNFINWLCKKAEIDDKIILITADLGYSVVEVFQKKFPKRFINVGIAEQNMVGIAAGLASEGFRIYLYSIGIFPSFRCAEQIRNDIDYHNLGIVIVTVGGGFTYGSLGYSHHAIQDIALIRTFPNFLIGTPCDPIEVENILEYQYLNGSPLYLRLHKNNEPELTKSKTLTLNKPNKINDKKGTEKLAIISNCFLIEEIKNYLKEKNLDIEIFSLPIWINKNTLELQNFMCRYKNIISVEDHLLSGGFSSWLLEIKTLNKIDTNIIPCFVKSNMIGKVASENLLIKPTIDDMKINIDSFL